MLFKSNQFYQILIKSLINEMGLFALLNFCVLCILSYLKPELESRSRLPISDFSSYRCICIYIYLIKGERDRVGQIIFCCNKKRKRRSSLITGQTLLRTPEWYFSKLDKPIKISDISAEIEYTNLLLNITFNVLCKSYHASIELIYNYRGFHNILKIYIHLNI